MRGRREQEGALSPGFLLFVVAAAVGSLFLVQFAHAHVLRTEAHTAADAAALAGARELRDQLLSAPGFGAPGFDVAVMEAAARSYAGRNDADLTGFTRTGPCTVRAHVRGRTNVTSGPSAQLQEGLPRARAAAEVQLPPLGGFGLRFTCGGGLELLDPARAGEAVGRPFPADEEFDVDLPDPADFDDEDEYEDALEAWEELRDAFEASQVEALAAWRDEVAGWAFGLLRNRSEVRLVAAD
ncbi:pilus assembly protein TadG-related protein [Egicoccus sp. AB-alg2]|uniref:pilus assembly protein TadG-related protein n=1 Tax=Egicoccus sp. AB-alg2 TaxID=3242693 RepID=UPI00359CEEC1